MGKKFDKVIIIMLENALKEKVLQNSYMKHLRKKGVFLSNSFGVTHSSQPNYIASVAGDTFGLFDDSPGYARWIYEDGPEIPMVASIVDLLEKKGYSWKNYAESLPPDYKSKIQYYSSLSFPGNTSGIPDDVFPFARKHVPFLSFPNVITNPNRLAKIVHAGEFEKDLLHDKLPNYSWYSPNLVNDGHSLDSTEKRIDPNDQNRSTNVDNIESFLKSFLGDDPISKFPPKTLLVITFDEAYPYFDPYEIYTLLIGDMLEADTEVSEPTNHYTMLRSIEENFGLGTLKRNDTVARPWWFLRD